MSSAAARAEARRKAILNRGTDRLAKLTTSARGDDAAAFVHDDPPLPTIPPAPKRELENFLGEESEIPAPRPVPRSSGASSFQNSMSAGNNLQPSSSGWSQEQQQLLNTLLASRSMPSPDPNLSQASDESLPDDPLSAIMSSFAQGGLGPNPLAQIAPQKPRTRIQKLVPLIHMLAVWCLVAFFVLFKEPKAFASTPSATFFPNGWWRWAELAKREATLSTWGIQAVPFLWAFVSLELVLHSLHIFTGMDTAQPPMLLSMALPHLPRALASIIIYGLKYMSMASSLLNDVAAAIVALGILVAVSGSVSDRAL